VKTTSQILCQYQTISHGNAYSTVVTCEIKHRHNFKIISKYFYFTRSHVWNWNKIISASEIISKIFQRHWTWKISLSCNKLLK